MSLAIDGLVSGLDTTSLINSLMQIEAAPQTLLKNRMSSTNTLVTALQSLNSSVAALATKATAAAKPETSNLFTATSSAPSVTVTASSGADAGRIDLRVASVAAAQVSVSAAMTVWPDSPATFTIVASDGTKTELTAASTALADIVDRINGADAGVRAVRVAAGTDSGGAPLYRLQFTSTETGADGAFSVYRGTAADVTANTATNLLTSPGAATVTTASNASVTLWAGTPAEQTISSSTNSFSELLPGVTVTVSAVESSPVAITVARNSAGVASVASGLVDSIKATIGFISQLSAVSTSSASGTAKTTAGIFTGNSTVRDVSSKVLSAATAPVDGRSPSEIGISITKDGTVAWDTTKFSAAYAADPEATSAMMRTIADRVADAATAASDKFSGSISTLIAGQQSSLRTINEQITQWDDRLATRRTTLENIYSALEVRMSALQSQSSWLTSQLAGLSSSTSTGA